MELRLSRAGARCVYDLMVKFGQWILFPDFSRIYEKVGPFPVAVTRVIARLLSQVRALLGAVRPSAQEASGGTIPRPRDRLPPAPATSVRLNGITPSPRDGIQLAAERSEYP